MHAQNMLATHPKVRGEIPSALIACIDACFDCAQTCASCADACLAEPNAAELVQCIRLNMDCADICMTTAAIASRPVGANRQILRRLIETCAEACRVCGDECSSQAERMEHCRICAAACRACEAACRQAAEVATRTFQ